MTTIGFDSGRATSFAVVATIFCCGNAILMVADAFQARTTEFSRPYSLSSPRQSGAVVQSLGGETNHWQSRQGRLFATTAPAVSPHNTTTSTNDEVSTNVESEESLTTSKVFFPPMEFEEETSVTTETRKRGRKRRAIQKMRQKNFSRPIDSRIARTMLFPMRVLVWKPLWMIMDIFIDRLEDDEGVNVLDSGDIKESIDVSTAAQTEQVESSAAFKTEESSISETTLASSVESVSDIATQAEATPLQSTVSTEEAVSEIVLEEEIVPAIDADDSDAATDDSTPRGDRWATAAPGVDFSGRWELIVTDDFKVEYDKYLAGLGQPKIVRSVALSGPVIGQTMEELIQIDQGQSLLISGKNVRGTWVRTLVASGSTKNCPDFEPLISPIKTVDQELAEAEAWWEDEGKSHVSWMRGVKMYGGGSFYSRRYFEEKEHEDDETVYACEGFFEFNDPNKENNELTWRFRRMAK